MFRVVRVKYHVVLLLEQSIAILNCDKSSLDDVLSFLSLEKILDRFRAQVAILSHLLVKVFESARIDIEVIRLINSAQRRHASKLTDTERLESRLSPRIRNAMAPAFFLHFGLSKVI